MVVVAAAAEATRGRRLGLFFFFPLAFSLSFTLPSFECHLSVRPTTAPCLTVANWVLQSLWKSGTLGLHLALLLKESPLICPMLPTDTPPHTRLTSSPLSEEGPILSSLFGPQMRFPKDFWKFSEGTVIPQSLGRKV